MTFPTKRAAQMSCVSVAIAASLLVSGIASAKSASDCLTIWNASAGETATTLPTDKGARYYAALRVSGKTVEDGKLTKEAFITDCEAGLFDAKAVDAGAPLKGANSFTENQAKDRAVWYGYADVSKLEKDADGIWRGTGTLEGKQMKVAIDFKGNVVGQ